MYPERVSHDGIVPASQVQVLVVAQRRVACKGRSRIVDCGAAVELVFVELPAEADFGGHVDFGDEVAVVVGDAQVEAVGGWWRA